MRSQNRVFVTLGTISLLLAACDMDTRVSQETSPSPAPQSPAPVSTAEAPAPAAPPAQPAESPPPESLRNFNIHFTVGNSQLTPQAIDVLSSAVTYLRSNPSARVKLSGFTDRSGPTAVNERLAEERVVSTVAFFEQGGIDGSRITSEARGEADPELAPSGEDPAAWNRRVEVELSLSPEG